MTYAQTQIMRRRKANEPSEYDIQALYFLEHTGATITAKLSHRGRMPWDTDGQTRDIYRIVISVEGQEPYAFDYGQSVVNSDWSHYSDSELRKLIPHTLKYDANKRFRLHKRKPPTAYDILACLTICEVGSLSDFCADFGYDEDSKQATETYLRIQDEWSHVLRLFAGHLEELQEIN